MRIESLLSARQFLQPQRVGDTLYFISDLSGRLSLYRMEARPGGSVPEPLLPPHLALQNPHLLDGYAFYLFPGLDRILFMLDHDGDENYQPMLVPLAGGFPEPAFGEQLAGYRVHIVRVDPVHNLVYGVGESRAEATNLSFRGDLATGQVDRLAESPWPMVPSGISADHNQIVLIQGYTLGDNVLYLKKGDAGPQVLYGTPLDQRQPGQDYPLSAVADCFFTPGNRGLLLTSALFEDGYGLSYMDLSRPGEIKPVKTSGARHAGQGELARLDHLRDNCYSLHYNIDGVSWLYEGAFDEAALEMKLEHAVCGAGPIANGVLESTFYDVAGDRHVLSYSTATSPTQLYTIAGPVRDQVTQHTREHALGLSDAWLSAGEDASFTSFDGLRTSARLYLPAPALGFAGPRPLVYYVHGGPQGQERPDFAWFSMPLIQYLTLNGFAVFVPNVRGSTGYGLRYVKHVDRDWGGQDRLDHIHAMTQVLPKDPRLDVTRAAVVGRSYGGYMTLTLASRHPELWSAAVDMFGPYNLLTFMDRIPVTWRPYFTIAVGDPEKDHDFLVERSPSTYIDQIRCPLLIIQGQNDPRVVEPESRDVVQHLRALGRQVDYLVFENEGHDVLKFENRVRCYNAITGFFKEQLKP